MELREYQDLLAKLLTDEKFRRSLIENESPDARLTPAELSAIGEFSESLLKKRLHEVRKLLPLTEQMFGRDSFAAEFRSFAGGYNPKSIKKHLEDAIGFCRYIRDRSVSLDAKHAANFESAKLRFFGYEKLFAFCRPAPRVDPAAPRRWPSFAIWLRTGRRIRHFIR